MDKESLKQKGSVLRRIFSSALFAIMLSVGFFAYEMSSGAEETAKIVENLAEIQNSLSTRYLGLFPQYIGNINKLLDEAIEEHAKVKDEDSVIICEDVLYYGIRSDVNGFRKMLTNIITLAQSGCNITIAYYNPDGLPFETMIENSLISSSYQRDYRQDIRSYHNRTRNLKATFDSIPQSATSAEREARICKAIDTYFDNYFTKSKAKGDNPDSRKLVGKLFNYEEVRTAIRERYFKASKESDSRRIENMKRDLLKPIPLSTQVDDEATQRVNALCGELDSIKTHYMNKPMEELVYADIYEMYKAITYAIADMLREQSHITMIPLREDLMMSCWMSIVNGKESAIFAFPSKYSTDEIGFISQDAAFSKYIQTMLDGMKLSHGIE